MNWTFTNDARRELIKKALNNLFGSSDADQEKLLAEFCPRFASPNGKTEENEEQIHEHLLKRMSNVEQITDLAIIYVLTGEDKIIDRLGLLVEDFGLHNETQINRGLSKLNFSTNATLCGACAYIELCLFFNKEDNRSIDLAKTEGITKHVVMEIWHEDLDMLVPYLPQQVVFSEREPEYTGSRIRQDRLITAITDYVYSRQCQSILLRSQFIKQLNHPAEYNCFYRRLVDKLSDRFAQDLLVSREDNSNKKVEFLTYFALTNGSVEPLTPAFWEEKNSYIEARTKHLQTQVATWKAEQAKLFENK